MTIDGYELVNTVKLDRARELAGPEATDSTILAFYDKLGGLITKGGQQIKTGCFWDAKLKKPFVEPKVIYIYSVNGSIVEVPEGTELPGLVRAQMILDEEANKQAEPAKTKRGGKKAAEPEPEEEDE